jgi:hypothetical protein
VKKVIAVLGFIKIHPSLGLFFFLSPGWSGVDAVGIILSAWGYTIFTHTAHMKVESIL